MMLSGHALTQSPQAVQVSVKADIAPGGRKGGGVSVALPRSRLRREILTAWTMAQFEPGGPKISCIIQIRNP